MGARPRISVRRRAVKRSAATVTTPGLSGGPRKLVLRARAKAVSAMRFCTGFHRVTFLRTMRAATYPTVGGGGPAAGLGGGVGCRGVSDGFGWCDGWRGIAWLRRGWARRRKLGSGWVAGSSRWLRTGGARRVGRVGRRRRVVLDRGGDRGAVAAGDDPGPAVGDERRVVEEGDGRRRVHEAADVRLRAAAGGRRPAVGVRQRVEVCSRACAPRLGGVARGGGRAGRKAGDSVRTRLVEATTPSLEPPMPVVRISRRICIGRLRAQKRGERGGG